MNITRIPRPLGLTNLVRTYRIDPTEENKQMINEHVVKTYVSNSFTWNHKKVSIDELSILTGIEVPTLLINMTRATRTLASIAKPEQLQDTIQSLVGLIIQNGINDASEIEEQLQKMKRAQGDSYAPFISAELNKTLKLKLDSNKALQDIVGLLKPTQGTLIQINNNGVDDQPAEVQESMVTTDKAILMISQRDQPLKDNDKLLEDVFKYENLDETPVVDARKQKGDHAEKEGLGLQKLTSGEHLDKLNITHENRREEEYDIDIESDEV